MRGVGFSVRAGEIVGLGGLVGSGRSEVARVIFGADRLESGTIVLNGAEQKVRSPANAVKFGGCASCPRTVRRRAWCLMRRSASTRRWRKLSAVVNGLGFIRKALERKIVTDLGASLKLKASRIDAPVSSLSGGNQQKVVLAKWFLAGGDVIILDEPTRGVDVGAKSEIYGIILKLAEEGKAVLVISSEHQELFGLCDRILVMGEGQLRGELTPADYSEEKLLSLA